MDVVGGNHTHISHQIKKFGIDISHFTYYQRRNPVAREQLAEAVALSMSRVEVMERLRAKRGEVDYKNICYLIRKYGIDASHFPDARGRKPLHLDRACGTRSLRSLTREGLSVVVAQSISMAAVLRGLGLSDQTKSARRYLKMRIAEWEIDTSHFLGQSHFRGCVSPLRRRPEEVLVRRRPGSSRVRSVMLTRALIESGRPPVCEGCGNNGTWLGKKITLHVDHIDGDWLNCTAGNLRFLCPNCHSQTPTFGRSKSSTGTVLDGAP
ncbi:hypothetical protein BIV57_15120 [Mangrovactinospora gilvigrisea]|uniref:HNH nuclease domain-containing protein n=2 Tax=Mangrovactinospora gilvigrisea TaxID=1428644 RepID=A0A1J7C519_9ACTN|nr:hypothetical protein BIV57_15120 [Mangrovactinospora gilvigrisea]